MLRQHRVLTRRVNWSRGGVTTHTHTHTHERQQYENSAGKVKRPGASRAEDGWVVVEVEVEGGMRGMKEEKQQLATVERRKSTSYKTTTICRAQHKLPSTHTHSNRHTHGTRPALYHRGARLYYLSRADHRSSV